jgi:hypothetical protein
MLFLTNLYMSNIKWPMGILQGDCAFIHHASAAV